MFLTRKEIIIRNVKKILYALGCAVVTFAVVFLMMVLFARHHYIHNWFYNLLGM